jgi:hypothetical protein
MIHEGELTNLLKYDDSEVDYSRGDTMYSIAINPDIEEWLSAVGKYSKYRFKDIAVTYSPAVPTTVSGKLIGFFETDIDDPLLGDDGEETIRRAMANVTAAQVDIWTQHTWLKSFRHEANDWWYTGSTYHEPRTAFQGRFVLIAGSDMTDEELPESLGDLTVTYRVEMMTPDLNIASTSGNQVAYTTSGGGVYNAPWANLLEQSKWDDEVDPDYQIPDGFAVKCTGDVRFEPPIGYYRVCASITGTGLGAWQITPGGGARYVKNGPARNADEVDMVNATATVACCHFTMAFPEGAYVDLKLAAMTTFSGGNISFEDIGGAIPYVSDALMVRRMLHQTYNNKLPRFDPHPRGRATVRKNRRDIKGKAHAVSSVRVIDDRSSSSSTPSVEPDCSSNRIASAGPPRRIRQVV